MTHREMAAVLKAVDLLACAACLFVLVADTLGRTLIAPPQLPAGLMIALVGAPYFVWILRRPRA